MARCPTCAEAPQQGRKQPLEKALDHLNPWQPLFCEACNASFWRLKGWPAAAAATFLALLVAGLLLNTVAQLLLMASGYSYSAPDDPRALEPGDLELRCPWCDSGNISLSVLQPGDRLLVPFNPWQPLRCVDCWRRFWRPRPAYRVALALLVLAASTFSLVRIPVAYRRRRQRLLRL